MMGYHPVSSGSTTNETQILISYFLRAPYAQFTVHVPSPNCTRLLTDLIDCAWGALEMHSGAVCSVGSVARIEKLRNVQLFKTATEPSANQIVLCKYATTLV